MTEDLKLRCGDHVRHHPTDEVWVVAFAEDDFLVAAGWPTATANVAECELVKRATDDEHRAEVGLWRDGVDDDNWVRAKVLGLYGEPS